MVVSPKEKPVTTARSADRRFAGCARSTARSTDRFGFDRLQNISSHVIVRSAIQLSYTKGHGMLSPRRTDGRIAG